MGLFPGDIQVGPWNVEKSKGKKKKIVKMVSLDFRFMGNCLSPRTKMESSTSGTSTPYAESKSTNESNDTANKSNDTSRGQPVVPVVTIFNYYQCWKYSVDSKYKVFLVKVGLVVYSKVGSVRMEMLRVKPGTGLPVAVKTLNHDGLQGHREWLAEVNYLGDLLHTNLVKLIGYCIEDDQRLLVYEFMPRGSLENHLFRRSMPLPWSTRMKIALGAAKGLAFLHEEAERPVIYRDFKTSNILLDAVWTNVVNMTNIDIILLTRRTCHLTSKSDVYSFGGDPWTKTDQIGEHNLVEWARPYLAERRRLDKNRPNGEHNLVEWARPYLAERRRFYRLIDPRLEGHFSIKGAQRAIQLAAHCLSRDPKARPLMSGVVETLKPLPNLKDMACTLPSSKPCKLSAWHRHQNLELELELRQHCQ
ncbi:hypothetical protein CXB51_003931 [Gossypium anomalum]|uniref:Protein kinase domain-containing protein n=1 Tax=Gossypium anomalum TaxID=47600 RepID=A0A8J6DBW1_9ROSI|nr:hypothetical protein CXB51_003931 [Gossypium anomalum]